MDNSEDVERLFSWLKAPQVHYREFAPQRELAEAVATWPVVHRAAVQTGIAAADEPAPEGDTAAKERIVRDRMTLPGPPVQHVAPTPGEEPVEPAPAPAETPPEMPSAIEPEERPRTAFDEREEVSRLARPEAVIAGEPAPGAAEARAPAEPTIAGFEQRAAQPSRPAAPEGAHQSRPAEPARHYPAPEREGLFSGEYRSRDRDQRPGTRVADRQDRSLDAVFTRLAGSRDRLPDPRARARTSPGLGPVFNRLR